MISVNKNKLALFFLKLSIASVLVYAAARSFVDPNSWIGFMPSFLRNLLQTNILLGLFSLYEIALAAWVMSSKKTFYASLVAAATFAGITIFNLAALDIVFRDFGLMLAALALAAMTYSNK